MKPFFFLIGLCASQIIPFDQTLPILVAPVAQVQAGQELHYQLSNFRKATCVATLSFHNSTFLPLSALAVPEDCAGDPIARIAIPQNVPNGTAAIQWSANTRRAYSRRLLPTGNAPEARASRWT